MGNSMELLSKVTLQGYIVISKRENENNLKEVLEFLNQKLKTNGQ